MDNHVDTPPVAKRKLECRARQRDDVLGGGNLNDKLFGGNGDDTLDGNVQVPVVGADILSGDNGTDSCTNGEVNVYCEAP